LEDFENPSALQKKMQLFKVWHVHLFPFFLVSWAFLRCLCCVASSDLVAHMFPAFTINFFFILKENWLQPWKLLLSSSLWWPNKKAVSCNVPYILFTYFQITDWKNVQCDCALSQRTSPEGGHHTQHVHSPGQIVYSQFPIVLRIRIRRFRMILGLPRTDPDPSIIKQKKYDKPWFLLFSDFFMTFYLWKLCNSFKK
jgi:hypothetical protein